MADVPTGKPGRQVFPGQVDEAKMTSPCGWSGLFIGRGWEPGKPPVPMRMALEHVGLPSHRDDQSGLPMLPRRTGVHGAGKPRLATKALAACICALQVVVPVLPGHSRASWLARNAMPHPPSHALRRCVAMPWR